MPGIQIHPHDILDEGTEQILHFVNKLGDVHYIFPQVNSIYERNPNPIGVLPRNKKNPIVYGNGKLFLPIHLGETNKELYQEVDSAILNGRDPLLEFKNGVDEQKYSVVPWFSLLNGDFRGDIEGHCVITFDGEKVLDWLCPNSPLVYKMWSYMFIETKKQYGYSTFMIDRIRYPDWSGEKVNPKTLFTCFCSRCKKKMNEKGMDVQLLINSFMQVRDFLRDKKFLDAVMLLKKSQHIQQWYLFRQDSITTMIKGLVKTVRRTDDTIHFWLDLWPPSYSWLLGQNYGQLTEYVPLLKHFPYHKLGGGADVQGLINYFTSNPVEEEMAFQAFLELFDFPYKITYEEFKRSGFPIKFIADENTKVRKASHPSTKIYSGIQMWNIEDNDLISAIRETQKSQADDLIYYCYGWAEDKHFKAASSLNR